MTRRFSPASVLLVLGSCLALQGGAAVAITLFPIAGPWGVSTLRLAIAGVLLMLITRPKLSRWDRRAWLAAVLFGAAMAGMNGTFYASLDRLPLSTAVAIEFLGPLGLAAVLSRRARDLIWIALAFAGMAVLGVNSVLSGAPLDPVGIGFTLVSAAFWAAYILAGSHAGRVVPGNGALAVGVLVAAVLVAPFGAAGVGPVLADPRLLLLALVTAVLGSVVPYSLEFAALRRMPRDVFGVLLSLEPVAAAVAGFVLLGQIVAPAQWVTIALVVTASVGITVSGARRTSPSAQIPAAELQAITAPIPLVATPRRRRIPRLTRTR
ncbi:EamA family transporter [Microbacterium gorillae]|uniref:EamA family transporter n=1 Tax=Microbacterium gorillae TaxID=1231063 RepID=UPI000AD00CCD|nr:EamA family transporter [Microbacterium gorillae]